MSNRDLIRLIADCAGIGLALTKKLARQGLNVVVVALNDQLLHNAFEELKLQHPTVSFKKVSNTSCRTAACWSFMATCLLPLFWPLSSHLKGCNIQACNSVSPRVFIK